MPQTRPLNAKTADSPTTTDRPALQREAGKLVSVIIPAYNRERFIDRAVRSVLDQAYASLEIIVVDDGSTDRTASVVHRLAREHASIRYVPNRRSKGPSGARNTGLLSARGDYVAFLDSDDTWSGGHLSEGLQFLEAHPDVKVVFGNFSVIDSDSGRPLYDFFDRKHLLPQMGTRDAGGGFSIISEDLFSVLMKENFFHVGGAIIRAGAMGQILFDESVRFSEDRDLAIRLAKESDAVFAVRWAPSFQVYRHPSNLSDFDDDRIMIEDYRCQNRLFLKYASAYALSVPESRLVHTSVRNNLLKMSYRYRRQADYKAALGRLAESLKYGLCERQAVELAKCIGGLLLGRQRNANR
ncbi:MAG: glycosyltransferase family 2 protein [Desulfobacterales bacterium]